MVPFKIRFWIPLVLADLLFVNAEVKSYWRPSSSSRMRLDYQSVVLMTTVKARTVAVAVAVAVTVAAAVVKTELQLVCEI